jgi:hypothetical protein
MILLDERAPLGRRVLAKELGISDGTVRGLLERFGELGIIHVDNSGAALTRQGKARLQRLLAQISVKKIEFLGESELVPGKSATAIHMPGKFKIGLTGVPQRDEAIRSGAQGSITIGVRQGRLVLPPDNRNAAEISPKEDERLRSIFNPLENDLIVIGFAANLSRSLSGALGAALTLA